jgi:hypothetical protein
MKTPDKARDDKAALKKYGNPCLHCGGSGLIDPCIEGHAEARETCDYCFGTGIGQSNPTPPAPAAATPFTDKKEFFIGITPEEGEMVVSSFDARQLERELAAAQDECRRLRDALTDISEYWNGGNGSAIDACEHNAEVASDALDAARKET